MCFGSLLDWLLEYHWFGLQVSKPLIGIRGPVSGLFSHPVSRLGVWYPHISECISQQKVPLAANLKSISDEFSTNLC